MSRSAEPPAGPPADPLPPAAAGLRLMLAQFPTVLWATDGKLRFTYGAGAGLDGIGCTPSDLEGVSLGELFGTDDPAFPPIAAHQRALRGEAASYETTYRGHVFTAHVEPFRWPAPRGDGCLGVALDVTASRRAARRQAAQAGVAESLAGAATLRDAAPGMLRAIGEHLDWDLGALWLVAPGNDRLVLEAVWAAPGVDAAAFEAAGRAAHVTPGVGPLGQVWASGQPRWGGSHPAGDASHCPAAAPGGLSASVAFAARADGRVAGVLEFCAREPRPPDEGLLQTLTTLGGVIGLFVGRQRSLEVLRQSEERFRSLATATAQLIWAADARGEVTGPLPAWQNYTGQADAEVLRQGWAAALHPADAPNVLAGWEASMRTRAPFEAECRVRRSDGAYRSFAVRAVPVPPNGNVREWVAAWTDVTERRQLEDQYRQAQKMEAVGRLAGGIAHDFNNLLTVINGYAELLLGRLRPGDPARDLVREVADAGERAGSLTRQLLAFSRQAIVEPTVLDLRGVLLDTEKLLRRVIGEDVRLETRTDPDLGTVRLDPGQASQVLMNLAVNARDAMPTGGTLTIELRNAGPGEGSGQRSVLLAVSDTGSGMTPEVQARIWEPFFTTKSAGKGTGLGLAVVQSIVAEAGGRAEVESEPSRGTTFRLYFPAAGEPAARGRPAASVPAAPRGRETLLVVEDDDAVRHLAGAVLRGCGYAVLEARDADEALRAARRFPDRLDLLVTDVVLPGVGGRELARRLSEVHAEVKVLYASGYTDDAVVRHGVREHEVAFLPKPYSPAALAQKVREVLDQH